MKKAICLAVFIGLLMLSFYGYNLPDVFDLEEVLEVSETIIEEFFLGDQELVYSYFDTQMRALVSPDDLKTTAANMTAELGIYQRVVDQVVYGQSSGGEQYAMVSIIMEFENGKRDIFIVYDTSMKCAQLSFP